MPRCIRKLSPILTFFSIVCFAIITSGCKGPQGHACSSETCIGPEYGVDPTYSYQMDQPTGEPYTQPGPVAGSVQFKQ